MRISVIRSREQFEGIREDWSAAYSADPETTVFVSWEWMRGWLESTPYEGFVLAAREDERSPYVAFLPLGGETVRNGGEEIRKLVIGGMPWSDNTGFVCAPGSEQSALPSFADFMQNHLRWDLFDMRNVSDRRLGLFLSRFAPESFHVREVAGTACPYILLPDSWERYLREFLGPCTRKHLKYYMKKAERLSGFRVVHTGEDNLEQQIDTLLALWQVRWGNASEAVLNAYHAFFRNCAAAGSLCLTTLWGGNAPFAAEAAFIDRKQGVFSGYTTGFNNALASLSPGNVMTGFHIRYAIENGFRIYDFGAGGEKYKYSFGTRERTNRNLFIRREPLLVRMKNSVPYPLKQVIRKLVMR